MGPLAMVRKMVTAPMRLIENVRGHGSDGFEAARCLLVGSGNPAHMVSDSRLFHFNLTSAEITLLAGQAAPLRNPFAHPPPGPSSALLSTPRATLVPRDAALTGLTAIGVAAIIAMAAVLRRVRRRGVAPAADLLV